MRLRHASFKPLAETKNLDYSIRLPKTNLLAYVDPDALNKILSNLYSNAVKYAQEKVDVRLIPPKRNSSTFSLTIKNDGFVIPPEMKEKIFQPFFRLKETKMLKGTGIGLALSRSLAELHKGSIELMPSENGLNVFMLTLPLHQDKEFDLYTQPAEPAPKEITS